MPETASCCKLLQLLRSLATAPIEQPEEAVVDARLLLLTKLRRAGPGLQMHVDQRCNYPLYHEVTLCSGSLTDSPAMSDMLT